MLDSPHEVKETILSNLPQVLRNVCVQMPDQSQRHIIAASLDDLCGAICQDKINAYYRSLIIGQLETLAASDQVRIYNVTANNKEVKLIERVIPEPVKPPAPKVDLVGAYRRLMAKRAAEGLSGNLSDDDEETGQRSSNFGNDDILNLMDL